MAPVAPTASCYVATAVHPHYHWEFTYCIVQGAVARIDVHHANDPHHINCVADYLLEIQGGLEHLLQRSSLPTNMATNKPDLMSHVSQMVHSDPGTLDTYRLLALIWVEQTCLAHAVTLHSESITQ